MTTMLCEAILFDLDGVLVDSTECVERSWRAWAARHGLDAETVLSVAHGRRSVETVRDVAPHLDLAAEVKSLEEYESMKSEGVYEVAGAHALLEALPPDRWAIVTSGTRPVASHRVRLTGLPMPDVMVCADEISHGKPHPEGYLTAAAKLGVAPAECIVIEDAPPGIEAARAAGMRCIGIAGTFPAAELARADVVVERLDALRVARRQDGGLEIAAS